MAARSLTRLFTRSVSSTAEAHRLARAPAQPAANPLARFQPVDSSPVAPEPDAAHLGEADVLERTAEGALISNGPSAKHVAVPKTAHGVPGQIEPADADLTSSAAQAPDRRDVWSQGQNPRANAMRGPRFEQLDMRYQPQPLAAIELIANEPIRLIRGRKAVCDGGGGPLGHPKVFINLDKPGTKACPYCGIRFEQEIDAHQ